MVFWGVVVLCMVFMMSNAWSVLLTDPTLVDILCGSSSYDILHFHLRGVATTVVDFLNLRIQGTEKLEGGELHIKEYAKVPRL